MPVKEISGSKLVIRLPDRDTLSEATKKFLDEQMLPNLNDGELWIKPWWNDSESEFHQLQKLGFNGEDHTDPDMYLYTSDNPDLEIPWALRTPVKYLDGKEPRMELLWLKKGSLDLSYSGRPFALVTPEEFEADGKIPRKTEGAYLHEGGMKIRVVLGDITKIKTDIIVNSANASLYEGGGVCGAIHRAAGPQLQEACLPLSPIKTGEAVVTPAFKLRDLIGAKYVIHAVGPRYPIEKYEIYNPVKTETTTVLASIYGATVTKAARLIKHLIHALGLKSPAEEYKIDSPLETEAKTALASTYRAMITKAVRLTEPGVNSITIPSISTGIYRFPLEDAAKIALDTLREMLPGYLWCTVVCYDQKTFDAYWFELESSIIEGKLSRRIEWVN